jgi:hypothetical protein
MEWYQLQTTMPGTPNVIQYASVIIKNSNAELISVYYEILFIIQFWPFKLHCAYNPEQNICDTSNYLTKCCNIIVNLENLPLAPTIQCLLHS